MANSILNSDDGSVSGSAGLKFTAGDDGVLKIQNNGTDALTIADTGEATLAGNTTVTGEFTTTGSATIGSDATVSGTLTNTGVFDSTTDSYRFSFDSPNNNDIRFTSGGIYCQLGGGVNGDPARTPVNFGVYLNSNLGYIGVYRNAGAAIISGRTGTGTVVVIGQDGVDRGTISVNGGTVSYNAFAGSHWAQLSDGSKPDLLRGTVLEAIDELSQWPDEDATERLCKVKVSDTAGSKNVYGVFMDWDHEWEATNDMLVTSLGAFVCRINANVTVQMGDLLESNGDGTARVQADDVIRSSTIGKVTGTTKTHQHDDGSYCVPIVLYCG